MVWLPSIDYLSLPILRREAEGSLGSSQSNLPSLRAPARFSLLDDAAQPQSHVRKPSAESIIQAPWINELIHQVLVGERSYKQDQNTL